MRDIGKQIALVGAFSMALLMASGGTAAGADLRLVEAVRNQDQQQVRTLLNQHADVNARSGDGSTALLWAAHWNALEIAVMLTARTYGCRIRQIVFSQPRGYSHLVSDSPWFAASLR